MPCLVTAVGFFFPRLVMVLLLIFSNWFSRAFETWFWPLLGFIFMPYTTLAYMISMVSNGGQISGGYIVLVVVAVFFDLGMHSDSSGKAVRYGKGDRRE
jgi:hypothetical protein